MAVSFSQREKTSGKIFLAIPPRIMVASGIFSTAKFFYRHIFWPILTKNSAANSLNYHCQMLPKIPSWSHFFLPCPLCVLSVNISTRKCQMDCKLNMLRYFCTVCRNKLRKLKILIFTTNQALTIILRNEKRNLKIAGKNPRIVDGTPASSFSSRKPAIIYLMCFHTFDEQPQ